MRHFCVFNINVCLVDEVSFVSETFHQSVQYRFLFISLIHGTVWCLFCPLPEPILSSYGTELQLYQQHLMKQTVWYQTPHVENSLPDCATVWGVITLNPPYKLSSQLHCLQTHVPFVHHLQET